MEIWKPIPNFSRYEASDKGNVRSLKYKNGNRTVVLKPCITGGYLQTMILNDDGKYMTQKIHRLITLAFYGERPIGKDEVNHIDGNKLNNRIENLEYVSRKENIQHCLDNHLQTPFVGSQVGTAKLTEDQVLMLRKLKKEGGRFWGRNELAKELGIAPKHLQKIVNRPQESWKHI